MTTTPPPSERWAYFRFAIVGSLLTSPPVHGALHAAIKALSRTTFVHPVTGLPVKFAYSTIERWFYKASATQDPFPQLGRKVRSDAGQRRSLSPALNEAMRKQYQEHPTWSFRLHYENLDAVVEKAPALGPLPSYSTVRRHMRAQGWTRQKRRTDHHAHHSVREVRSYEMANAHALWHLDFHHCSRRVLLPDGTYTKAYLMAILDDHSRLCCHAQWYLNEGVAELVHALCQAFMKRGLPRALMMDNGAAMKAAELCQGLARLGIEQSYTLPESPYQNGKQEAFFAPVEGKCIAMLEGVRDLDLKTLNDATTAWVEHDYNRTPHEGIDTTPLDRLRSAHSDGRESPSMERLRAVFREEHVRTQRRGDGTISVLGVRFEVPSHYRHIELVHVRAARWDLSRVTMVDPRHGTALVDLFPLDKQRNADGHRKAVDPTRTLDEAPAATGIAPHLQRLMDRAAQTGLPAAYLPMTPTTPSCPSEMPHD